MLYSIHLFSSCFDVSLVKVQISWKPYILHFSSLYENILAIYGICFSKHGLLKYFSANISGLICKIESEAGWKCLYTLSIILYHVAGGVVSVLDFHAVDPGSILGLNT